MERVVSGIQPTGQLHIGNYIGMLKQSVEIQRETTQEIF
jgi:tryptophanyl-tRNA synthetase